MRSASRTGRSGGAARTAMSTPVASSAPSTAPMQPGAHCSTRRSSGSRPMRSMIRYATTQTAAPIPSSSVPLGES